MSQFKSVLFNVISSVFLTVIVSANSFAVAVNENPVMNFKPIIQKALTLKPSSTLLVLDIDNTLLKFSRDNLLGSSQWWYWQTALLKQTQKGQAIVPTMSALLDVNNYLLANAKLQLTELDLPRYFSKLNHQKYFMMALTARGCQTQSATLTQLRENHLLFKHAPGDKGFAGSFLPNIKRPRPVCYNNGVMLVAGQNKGVMLSDLLHRTHFSPKNIIFVDDSEKNVRHVVTEFNLPKYKNIHLYAYRYAGLDAEVAKFNQPNSMGKRRVTKQWGEFKSMMQSVFGWHFSTIFH